MTESDLKLLKAFEETKENEMVKVKPAENELNYEAVNNIS